MAGKILRRVLEIIKPKLFLMGAAYTFKTYHSMSKYGIMLYLIQLSLMPFLTMFVPFYFMTYTGMIFPLPEGELKEKMKKVATENGFPSNHIYYGKSKIPNAGSIGFHRFGGILILGNMDWADDFNSDEVAAVFAHEVGHWKKDHFLKSLVPTLSFQFLVVSVYAEMYTSEEVYQAFGFHDCPVYIGFLIITKFLMKSMNVVFEKFFNEYRRNQEREADRFVVQLNMATNLKSALIKVMNKSLSFPLYDELYMEFNCQHPPFMDRINAIRDA